MFDSEPVIINKNHRAAEHYLLNRCTEKETVGTKTKKLKHLRSSQSIACPTRSRTGVHHSFSDDWAMRLHRNQDKLPCDESPANLANLRDVVNSVAAPASSETETSKGNLPLFKLTPF